MKIQMDGEITDIQTITTELKQKGLQIISIEVSRWIGTDEQDNPIDRGGRIDIEVSDDHILKEKIHAVYDIQIAMIESEITTATGDVQELKKERDKHKKQKADG